MLTEEEKRKRNAEKSRRRRAAVYAQRGEEGRIIEQELQKGNEIYNKLVNQLETFDKAFAGNPVYPKYRSKIVFYIKNANSSLTYFGSSHYVYVLKQAFDYMNGAIKIMKEFKEELSKNRQNSSEQMGK